MCVCVPDTLRRGASGCFGWNTLTTPWSRQHQGCPLSWRPWGTSRPCLSTRKRDRRYLRRCRRIWQQVRAALAHSPPQAQRQANRRRVPAPSYRPGQRAWLSAKDLPLQVGSRKLGPLFIGPFETERVVNPVAVRLKVPASLKVHPTFHVSRIKPVTLHQCGSLTVHQPTPWREFWTSVVKAEAFQYLIEWEGARRKVLGSPSPDPRLRTTPGLLQGAPGQAQWTARRRSLRGD